MNKNKKPMHCELELVMKENKKSSVTVLKIEKHKKKLLLEVNQIDHFLWRSNTEIHGTPVSDNKKAEDVEKL